MLIIDFSKIFDEYIKGKQKVWKHDRSTTVGASEVFDCFRKLVFEKRGAEWGYEPDDQSDVSMGAAERGNIIEDHYVVPALSKKLPELGLELHFAGQATQETLVLGRNSSTPDGLITGVPNGPVVIKTKNTTITLPDIQEGCLGLEIKSIDPRANLLEERAKHRGQSQMGLALMRELTEWKPRYWIILYIDASFIDHITPFVIEYDEDVFKAGVARAEAVWACEDPMKATPEGKFDNACDHCKWTTACGAATFSAFHASNEKPDGYTDAALEPYVRDYLAAQQAEKDAAFDFENAKQTLKAAMAEMKVRRVSHPEFSAVWSTVKGSTRLDTDALKKSGIDLTPFMKETAGYDKLVVTPKKEKT